MSGQGSSGYRVVALLSGVLTAAVMGLRALLRFGPKEVVPHKHPADLVLIFDQSVDARRRFNLSTQEIRREVVRRLRALSLNVRLKKAKGWRILAQNQNQNQDPQQQQQQQTETVPVTPPASLEEQEALADKLPKVAYTVTISVDTLCEQAEHMRLKKKLLPSQANASIKKEVRYAEFRREQMTSFEGFDLGRGFFSSGERQRIMMRMIEGAMRNAETGTNLLLDCVDAGILEHIFPVHDAHERDHLVRRWVRQPFKPQPLAKIASYFGTHVAFYFAWLGSYTRWLVVPTVLGIWLHQHQTANDATKTDADPLQHYDKYTILYSILLTFYATLFLEGWKRHNASLAYRWDCLDADDADSSANASRPPRSQYKGTLRPSPITGDTEIYFPSWKRWLRYSVTFPIILIMLLLVFVVMLGVFAVEDYFLASFDPSSYIQLVPTIVYGATIPVANWIYGKVAHALNDFENHRTQSQHDNSLIVKLVLFHFVNNYMAIYYLAFYVRDMQRLRNLMATLLITSQILGNLT